jgi:hypothetical protein
MLPRTDRVTDLPFTTIVTSAITSSLMSLSVRQSGTKPENHHHLATHQNPQQNPKNPAITTKQSASTNPS